MSSARVGTEHIMLNSNIKIILSYKYSRQDGLVALVRGQRFNIIINNLSLFFSKYNNLHCSVGVSACAVNELFTYFVQDYYNI